MMVHLLRSTSLICSFFQKGAAMAVTDILHGSVAFAVKMHCFVCFCFN